MTDTPQELRQKASKLREAGEEQLAQDYETRANKIEEGGLKVENEVVVSAADYEGADDGMPKRPPIGSQLAAEWTEVNANYSEKAMAFRFIITEEGPWKDKEDMMTCSKLPSKKEDGSFFWPAKNFAKATGIKEEKKGGKITISFGEMVGKPFTIVYGKDKGEYGEFPKPKTALPPTVVTEG